MSLDLLLQSMRTRFGYPWVIFLFASFYLVSQLLSGVAAWPIVTDLLLLQVSGFTEQYYIDLFTQWDAQGYLDNYKAHLYVDSVHMFWYTPLLIAVPAYLMERANVSRKANVILILAVIPGVCDIVENSIQFIFLSTSDYRMIYDPFPLISTIASLIKWICSGIVMIASTVLLFKKP